MANNYATTTDFKAVIPDSSLSTTTDTGYDTALGLLITFASRAIDRTCGRWEGYFYATTDDQTRWFDGNSATDGGRMLWIDPMPALPTSVSIAESGDNTDLTALSTDDYNPYPFNWSSEGKPFSGLLLDPVVGDYSEWPSYRRSVKVVGRFGHATAVPAEIKAACVMQTMRWFKRLQASMQTAGAIPELGTLVYSQLDPDIAELLKPYILVLVE